MTEDSIFNFILIGWLALGVVVFLALFFVVAPYGRHVRRGWGYAVGNRTGWVIMEAASPIVFLILFILRSNTGTVSIIFLLLWEAHYLHRAFIYPFSLRGTARRMPLSVVSFGIFFNLMNGYLNGRYIFTLSPGYTNDWLGDPRFIAGVALFIIGFIVNRQSDSILRTLRKPGESDYRIANNGLYRWVSCPNYLGEITIWVGWAIATWSIPGLAFALWTMANLMPRARANHDWYRRYFHDYPEERKALVPHIW